MSEVEQAPIRTKAFIYGIIVVALNSLIVAFLSCMSIGGSMFNGNTTTWDPMYVNKAALWGYLPIFLISVTLAILKPIRNLTKQETMLIVTMTWVSWVIPTGMGITPFLLYLGTARDIPAYTQWTLGMGEPTNWLYGPDPTKPELWNSWLNGGPVNWYMPQLIFGILWMLPWYLLFVFTATFFRRLWIDVEGLPFPMAEGAVKMVDMSYEENNGRPTILKNPYIYIGIIIGFLGMYRFWMPFFFPNLGVTRPSEPYNDIFFPLSAYTGGILPRGNLDLSLSMWLVAGFLLMPRALLQSMLLCWIIVNNILPSVFAQSALWDPSPGTTGSLTFRGTLGPVMSANWIPIFGNYGSMIYGTMFGLILYPMWAFRIQLVQSIKGIFAKQRTSAEENEPMRSRHVVLGWILSFLWLIAVSYYASNYTANFIAILVVQLSSLFSIGVIYSRVSAEMGQWWAQFWHDQEGWFRGTQESWIADPQSPLFMPDPQARYLTARAAIYEEMGTMKAGNPMALMMENYKMGSLSGLHSKYVLLGGIIAIVVALVIGMFAFTGFWQTFGAKKLTQFAYTGPPNNMPQRSATYIAQEVSGISYLRGFWNNWSYNVAQVTGFSVGTVIAVAIYLIKARVPWFPLSPAGWALSAFFSTAPLLLPIIIGFVAKTLAARLGRDYDEKLLKPIAIGILVGCTLVNLATGLYEYGQVLTR